MFYIGYYTTPNDVRISSPAANAKIISISEAFVANGIPVDIISSCTVAKKNGYIKGRCFEISKDIKCKQFALWGTKFGPLRRLQYILANLRIFFLLIFFTKKNENVMVYHAIERSVAIMLAKRIKKFRLILEVEEIYSDALQLTPKEVSNEMRIISMADAYIFPTVLLNQKLNLNNKPYALIHGTYKNEPDRLETQDDNKIHVVYAGTLDATKGGAVAAVRSAKYLPEQYFVHILGFGDDAEVAQMKKEVTILSQHCKCDIAFEGYLRGEEYIRFIQKCHIGLSTQNPEASFNDTSFPSKILSYMANGLKVVSVRIPVVETSAVSDFIYYYDKQEPEEIARAIKGVDLNREKNSRDIIGELNKSFVDDLKKIVV